MDRTGRLVGAAQLPPGGRTVDETRYLARTGEARGDPGRADAFRSLAEQHLDANYRLATIILGNGVEAQDVVHDAFITAWQKWHTLRDPERFEAWFRRIVVNTCRNRLRRGRRWKVQEISDDLGLRGTDEIGPIEDQVVVRRALDQLKPDDRIVLALRYYRDMKVDDVADAMGIRPRAVSSRLHRALGRLRRVLEEQEHKEAAR